MELVEYVSGARMHACLYLPSQELYGLITDGFILKTYTFLRQCYKSFSEMFISLFNNRVWKLRLVNVGIIDKNSAVLFGATGPILKSVGMSKDLRVSQAEQYAAYEAVSFRVFVGIYGDSFDRFLIRSRELFESMHIILQTLNTFTSSTFGIITINKFYGVFSSKSKSYNKTRMESLIIKFKTASDFIQLNNGISYKAVEAGKGEFGVLIVSAGESNPYRAFLRSPAYNHLQLLPLLGSGHYFADLITLVGTLDLVFGEIDR